MTKIFFPKRFEDKVMIITGAARGIGRATALRAAKEGAKLVLVDNRESEGQETLKMVLEEQGTAIFLALDISLEEHCQTIVEEAIKTYGKLDIAINNAGVMGNPSPLHELPKENMDFTMQNNFYSTYFCCKHEIQKFIEQGQGGVIVNNASIAGLTGLPGNPAY
ncbi:MAG: SDR family NAD(P)-dependent oxidoreductase, partial [bacterium]|nr:SDR family NAD(P)-dependent oxidoreductase [bacterium]